MSDTGGPCPACRTLLPSSVVTGVLTPVPAADAETAFSPPPRPPIPPPGDPAADTTGLPMSAGGARPLRPAWTAQCRTALRLAVSHHPAARYWRHGRGLSGLGRGAGRRGRAEGHSARGDARPAAAHDIERRFKQELLLARQVTHKNVVRIHDLGEIDGIKYITMPYIEGAGPRDRPAQRASCPSRKSCRSPGRWPQASRPRTTPAWSIAT